jgi:hypothetical protein
MPTLRVETRFAFGDLVRFDSPTQGRAGTGKVFAITLDLHGRLDYMIDEREGLDIRPGILENEISLLGGSQRETCHTLTVQTRFPLGARVHFDSPTQRRKGSGQVFGVTIDCSGNWHYIIDEGEQCNLLPGILEHEIVLEE